MTPSFDGNHRTQGQKILSRKTRVLDAANGEDFVILASTVLIQCQGVTDGRTDRRTERQTPWPWLRRAKHSVIARKNCQPAESAHHCGSGKRFMIDGESRFLNHPLVGLRAYEA